MPNETAYAGAATLTSPTSPANVLDFVVRQILGEIGIAKLVRVEKVTNAGGLSPAGEVDVLPLVAQVDGFGQTTPHAVVYGLPYLRMQGGTNAVILDPQVGDIGLAVFCDRDISAVKSTKAPGPPGSFRQFSMSDGLYVGGFLNGTPTQYVQFTADGITVHSPGTVTLDAPEVVLTGNLTVAGDTQLHTLTTDDVTSLAGGAEAVRLASGAAATKVTAT